MAYTYFLSYARADLGAGDETDDLLDEFIRDLAREVSVRGGIPAGEVGFVDREVPAGAEWARRISDAISTCKVFVPDIFATLLQQ